VEAANDVQTVWVNTACGKDHSQKYLSKLIVYGTDGDQDQDRCLKDQDQIPIITFISSRLQAATGIS